MAVVVVAIGSAASLHAQAPTGAIEGVVTDKTGAVLPGAGVKVIELATSRTLDTTTTEAGLYIVRSLLPGKYRVEVKLTGFKTGVLENITVAAGQVANGNMTLEVGAVDTVTTVTAVGAQVDTVRQTVDGVITAQQIERLPLDARNFQDLAVLEPGVIVRDGGNIDPTKVNAYRVVGIAGRSGTATRVQIDGIDVTDETVGTTTVNLSADAVQEFQLTRSSLDLSTSLTSSGAVSVISKSGGNEVHGSAFYFFHNQATGSRLQFNPEKVPFHRHQVGFNAGGPFIKDKLFWFSNWERFYQTGANVSRNPLFPQLDGTVNLPVGIRYVNQRVDWNVTNRLRAFYRFNHSWDITTGPTNVPAGPSPFQNIDWTNIHVAGLDFAQPHLTHSFRFGYVNFNNRIDSKEFDKFKFLRTSSGLPYYLGVGPYGHGPNGLAPQQTYQDNFQWKYDGSWLRGSHNFRYGMEVTRIILGGFANFAGPLSISGDFTQAIRNDIIQRGANPQNPLEYPLEGFSTGPNAGYFTVAPAHNLPHGGHFNTRIAWYVGDNWRARQNLHLNFGTRWEYDTGYFNQAVNQRPDILDYWVPGASKNPKMPKNKFGPSFGFAWDPWNDSKTSIRGGFYLAYEMNIFNNLLFDQYQLIPPGIGPDEYDHTSVQGPDGRPIDIGGFPNGDYSSLLGRRIGDVVDMIGRVHEALQAAYQNYRFDPTGTPLFIVSRGGPLFGGMFPGDFKIPYSMQFNIGFQRELRRGTVLSVDYLRNRGVGLPFMLIDFERRRAANTFNAAAATARVNSVLQARGVRNVDEFIAANPTATIAAFGLANDTVFQGRTPDPNAPYPLLRTTNFGRARFLQGGFSLYNALQVKLQGRAREKAWLIRNADYVVSYALGRSEATSGSSRVEFINGPFDNDQWNGKVNFGPSGLDRTHILTAGVFLGLPGGFRIDQLWSFRTATPMTFTVPAIGRVVGANALFTTDINGDGGIGGGAPRGDLIPGLGLNRFGRKVKSIKEMNRIIQSFNNTYAGRPTPAGQALIRAGLFTESQLRQLGAMVQPIPLVPENNPWPFDNLYNLDVRITRPIAIKRPVETLTVEPYLDVFNVFNHTGLGTYGGLGATFGSLNFDYANAPVGSRLPDLTRRRGRALSSRLLQVGFRVRF